MEIFRTRLAAGAGRLCLLPFALGVATLCSAGSIVPYSVNDSGTIVGEYTGGTLPVAFLYNPATSTYSFFNPPGATSSGAVGINDSGQISGTYTTSTGSFGFLLNASGYTTISPTGAVQQLPACLFCGGGTIVGGINDTGVIVGDATTASGDPGFVYSGGTFSNFSYPSAVVTGPYAINDFGIASGTAVLHTGNTFPHVGFLYNTNTSTFTTIAYPGATNTEVQGINDSGEVVGFYNISGSLGGVGTEGFLYLNGVYTPIMYPGSNSTALFGISNDGEITGTYSCASGPCAADPAFFATPTLNGFSFTTLVNPTPEPASVVLFGSGLIALLGVARKMESKRGPLRHASRLRASAEPCP